jgi:hypothetical protein
VNLHACSAPCSVLTCSQAAFLTSSRPGKLLLHRSWAHAMCNLINCKRIIEQHAMLLLFLAGQLPVAWGVFVNLVHLDLSGTSWQPLPAVAWPGTWSSLSQLLVLNLSQPAVAPNATEWAGGLITGEAGRVSHRQCRATCACMSMHMASLCPLQ